MVYCAGLEIRFRHFGLIWNDLDTSGLSFLRFTFFRVSHLDTIGLHWAEFFSIGYESGLLTEYPTPYTFFDIFESASPPSGAGGIPSPRNERNHRWHSGDSRSLGFSR